MWAFLQGTGYVERLVAATLAGIILGLPYLRRPGGIRTHVLVTLGAAYFCTTSFRIADDKELLRVVQGIASGVGFIGAASVLRTNGHVMGIATAASIWIAAAVGCEAGFGDPLVSVITAIAISIITWVVSTAELKLFRSPGLPPSSKDNGNPKSPTGGSMP